MLFEGFGLNWVPLVDHRMVHGGEGGDSLGLHTSCAASHTSLNTDFNGEHLSSLTTFDHESGKSYAVHMSRFWAIERRLSKWAFSSDSEINGLFTNHSNQM